TERTQLGTALTALAQGAGRLATGVAQAARGLRTGLTTWAGRVAVGVGAVGTAGQRQAERWLLPLVLLAQLGWRGVLAAFQVARQARRQAATALGVGLTTGLLAYGAGPVGAALLSGSSSLILTLAALALRAVWPVLRAHGAAATPDAVAAGQRLA